MLDLLLADCSERVYKVEVVDNFSDADHVAVQFLVEAGRRVALRSKRKVYNFRKVNFNRFRDLLAVIPWSSCFLGCRTDEAWVRFKDLLLSVADQCIPKVSLCPKKRMNWLSEESLHMMKQAFRLAK